MRELTEKQKAVLTYIGDYTRENGYPPSFRDMAVGMGYRSQNSVQAHIKALHKKGYIKKTAGVARSLQVNHAKNIEG